MSRPTQVPGSFPAIGRLLVQDARGQSWGSGTVVELGGEPAGTAYVVTAWHVLREWDGRTPPVVFLVENGTTRGYQGRLVASDQESDLALVCIRQPAVQGLKINAVRPPIGAVLRIVGWGQGTLRCAAGRVARFLGTRPGGGFDLAEIVGAPARDGDSGGAILDDQGRLAGVISATDGQAAVGTCGQRLGDFLARAIGEQRAKRIEGIEGQTRAPLVPVETTPPCEAPGRTLDVWPGATLAGRDDAPLAPREEAPSSRAGGSAPVSTGADSALSAAGELIGDVAGAKTAAAWLTAAATALGFTMPPAALVAGGVWLARRWWRRRGSAKLPAGQVDNAVGQICRVLGDYEARLKAVFDGAKKSAGPEQTVDQAAAGEAAATGFRGLDVPRDNTEAKAFLRLSQVEGRDPVHDALVGRLALDELDRAIESVDQSGAAWARKLKETLEKRFNEMVPLALTPAAG